MKPTTRLRASTVEVSIAIVAVLLVIGGLLAYRALETARSDDLADIGAEPSPTFVPAEAPALTDVPADVRAQLEALPAGTVLVACSPSVSKYPEGVRPSRPAGWSYSHPGFVLLKHGYCADNPNAMPIPLDIPNIDGTQVQP